jgi:salicylate hydroxylase
MRGTGWTPRALPTRRVGSDICHLATPVAGWQTSNVTLLGDAIHTMTPLQGLGANTALRDASLLCRALTQVNAGHSALLPALEDYERAMRLYAFAAVRQSLQQTEMFVSENRFARTAFKAVLRTASAVPPLKRRMFRPTSGV